MDSSLIHRRDFLKKTFLGGALAMAPNLIPKAWSAAQSAGSAARWQRMDGTRFQLGGAVQAYLSGVTAAVNFRKPRRGIEFIPAST